MSEKKANETEPSETNPKKSAAYSVIQDFDNKRANAHATSARAVKVRR